MILQPGLGGSPIRSVGYGPKVPGPVRHDDARVRLYQTRND